MTYEPKICPECNKTFNKGVDEAIARWNKRIYCSRKCNDDHKRTAEKTQTFKYCNQCGVLFNKVYEETWLKWQSRRFCSKKCADIGKIRKAPSTAFKKGHIPANFKEKGFGYNTVHKWLTRHFPKKGICEECLKESKTQYANITGKYLRDRSDYRELCYSCHTRIDRANPKYPSYTHACISVV